MHTLFLTISRTNRTDSGEVLGDDLGLSDPYYCHAHSLYGKRQSQGHFPLSLYNNHFSEMKGDVGMSLHEKEGEQKDAYTKTETHS